MVVFTCAHCGDSVQKPKVEKHYDTKCRNRNPDLCCVDCLRDFRGDEFVAHTKCVTEAERYGGKGFVSKPGRDKGERKQSAWMETVRSVIDDGVGVRESVKRLLEKVSEQPNAPRKETKFYNFVRSLDRRFTRDDAEAAWELLKAKLEIVKASAPEGKTSENGSETLPVVSKEKEKEKEEDTEDRPLSKKEKKEAKKRAEYEARLEEVANETAADPETKKERKKRKRDEPDASDAPEPNKKAKEDFDWIGAITAALVAKGNEMRVKRLQKRVLTEWCAANGVAEAPERCAKKFSKTLYNLENVRLEGERAIMS